MDITQARKYYDRFKDEVAIPGVTEEWREYRKSLTDFIIENGGNCSNVAVWGAGRCNDIDLARLSRAFGEVTLIDIDGRAMSEAVKNYGVGGFNTKMRILDFAGVHDNDYFEFFCDGLGIFEALKIGKAETAMRFADKCRKDAENIYLHAGEKPIPIGNKEFDLSIAVGVHSQLNFVNALWDFIKDLCMGFPSSRNQNFLDACAKLEQLISFAPVMLTEKLNRAIIDGTGDSIIFGYEKKSAAVDSPVSGAYEAALRFKLAEDNDRLLATKMTELVWPFDLVQNKIYTMEIIKYSVK